MSGKVRLSASVDAELMVAAADSVAAGSAPSLSAWVSAAMRRHLEHERSLSALGAYLAAFEADFRDDGSHVETVTNRKPKAMIRMAPMNATKIFICNPSWGNAMIMPIRAMMPPITSFMERS